MTTPDSRAGLLGIVEVECLTGIRQATLRMWERRYGFPQPLRNEHGERVYPPAQVERLKEVRYLILQGARPGRILAGAGAAPLPLPARAPVCARHLELIDLLRAYRLPELHAQLLFDLMRDGLRDFVLADLGPLAETVAESVRGNTLPLRFAHLFEGVAATVLQRGLSTVRTVAKGRPRAVLASLAGDPHALEIQMVDAILTILGIDCLQLGADTPPQEIAAAAIESGAHIVGVSVDLAAPRRNLGRTVASLRDSLPAATAFWIGGSGTRQLQPIPGVEVIASLAGIEAALAAWRTREGVTPA